jgi:hypothetical protein
MNITALRYSFIEGTYGFRHHTSTGTIREIRLAPEYCDFEHGTQNAGYFYSSNKAYSDDLWIYLQKEKISVR